MILHVKTTLGWFLFVMVVLRLAWVFNHPEQDAHIKRYLEHIEHPTNTFALKVYPKS